MAEIQVTVFTPTYNRAKLIPGLYESLKGQTCLSFEWVVVVQGEDGTEEQVRAWQKEAPFPVVCHRLSGERGIGRAMNAMMDLARGRLVFKVDDDDRLTPDAVQAILDMEQTLPDRDLFAGVSGIKIYPDGRAIGKEWSQPGEYVDCTNLQRAQYGLMGDKAEAYYLKWFREYGPIPVEPGEYYTWEAVLYDRIAHAGKPLRWFNRKIYVAEYLPDGATAGAAQAKLNNLFTYTHLVAERMGFQEIPLRQRLILCMRYFELVRLKKLPFSAVRSYFEKTPLIARLGYWGSALTRHIPGGSGRQVPIAPDRGA